MSVLIIRVSVGSAEGGKGGGLASLRSFAEFVNQPFSVYRMPINVFIVTERYWNLG